MDKKQAVSKQRRPAVLAASLLAGAVAVFMLVQVIFAAGSAVDSQSGAAAVLPSQEDGVITGTLIPGMALNMEAGDALGEYLRANTTYIGENGLNAVTAVADLSGSSKSVNMAQAVAGSSLNYTIVVSNSGNNAANNLLVTDTLPAALTYQSGTFTSTIVNGFTSGQFDGIAATGVITWSGSLGPNGQATLRFSAVLTDSLAENDVVTNTVMIDDGTVMTREASTTIVAQEPFSPYTFLPVVFKSLTAPVAQISRPNSQNQWTVSWVHANTNPGGFEIQESQDPTFNTILGARTVAGNVSSSLFQKNLSTKNEYFYRVRALGQNSAVVSPWSAPVSVIGGYFDGFDNSNSGWAIRRTTLLEEVRSWYEVRDGDTLLIMQVEDSWDWGIAAPYKVRAPKPPYAIEYRSQIAHKANLLSHGAVFGADWPGGACPDYSSVAGIYQHNICFNHFYNTNIIYFAKLKLLFERVDYLEWRPQDGGSPMKRGSFDNYASWFSVDVIPNVDPDGWNTFRIEVRDSGIKMFANGQQYASTADNLWVNEPYFGVFASADEYSNSTWRFDYYKVSALDN